MAKRDKMITLENEHYLRTILLLCEGGAYIAKQIIGRELSNHGGDLDALLKQSKNKLRHEFHEKQMEKLFPNNGYDKTDVNKWDIQMLIGVMLLLFRKSLSDEEKQKLKEIKFIRHEVLAHSPSASLCLEKYEDVQKDLRDAINKLAGGFDQTVKDKCKEYIKTYASDPLEVKSAIKRLQEAKDTGDLFQEVINVMRKSQETLSNEIHAVESTVRQDVKETQLALSKELRQEVGRTKKELTDKLNLVEDNVRQDVKTTKEKLEEEIEKIEGAECNTFQALSDVSCQIKSLQQWLVDNLKEQRNRTSEDLSSISQQLQHKAEEIEFKVRTYDETSSQPIDRGNAGIQHVSFCREQVLKKKNKLLVAAIDFGTTYSGYAYSLRRDYKENPLRIVMNGVWSAGCLMSMKAPTAVLFDPEKNFDSFGYDAETKYSDLAFDREHHDWFFFRRFKTFLYNRKIYRSTELEAANGNKMNAKEVFAAVIKYLKDHLIDALAKRATPVGKDDTHWILTVPAIWTDRAKQFMREAAHMAGIEGDNLSIALEPEAASIYCQTVPFCNLKEGDEKKFEPISSGKKYIVIDLGGGTMDVTVHEKQSDGRLKEVYKASGSTAGSMKIDDEFIRMIEKIVGKDIFLLFQKKYQFDYLDLLREFEGRKRFVTDKHNHIFTIKIPHVLVYVYQDSTQKTLMTAVEESVYNGKIQATPDKLRIPADIFKSLFKPCNDMIVGHISNLLNHEEVKGTDVFLLVGGLSECDILQNCIKKAFPNVQVIVPNESSSAVLKGAVLFGHRPLAISSRVSKHSYGLSISPLYDPSIHPENRRVFVGSTHRCRDVFMKFIACGEAVRIGDARSWELSTLWPNQQEMTINLYVSSKPDPKYVDEDGTEYLGNIVVDLPGSRDDNVAVNVSMMFGETELMVEATEMSRQKKYRAYFDCL
ncbi:heat shock 70 kDa protein 12A-like [Mercenaria mercenaria]|uniref:heat shock 70 kDa protein 12A-like n=1 Tax=Mercenaria mercenaria TaxID=6596 RepID=UPI00234F9719|nr:heat shock 70 kDa protein 12A-like [Mercenaria mercenaria]